MALSDPHSGPDASREILTRRLVGGTREEVFAAFRDPARLARWWGPNGFTNTFETFDFRPGGSWRFVMHGPDGVDYRNESAFAELVPPGRIVVRHLSGPRFDLTITLAEKDGGTEIGWRMRFATAEERDKVARYAVGANEQNLDRLEAELARG